MSLQPGSVPWLKERQERQLRADYQRAKTIRDLSMLNFDTWPDMNDLEKDATMRQVQRGVSELAGMAMRVIRYELEVLRNGD